MATEASRRFCRVREYAMAAARVRVVKSRRKAKLLGRHELMGMSYDIPFASSLSLENL